MVSSASVHIYLFHFLVITMSDPKITEGKSTPSSAGGGAPASEQIALLNRKAGYCKRRITLKLQSAETHSSRTILDGLLQVLRNLLDELASLHAAKMEPYQQLIEGGAQTDEAVSELLMQDEASELEYRARVAELQDRLRASTFSEGDAAAAPLSSTSSGAVLQSPATVPPPTFSFRAPQLDLPIFSDNDKNEFAFSEFKTSFNNALQATPNMTSTQKFIFLRSLLRGRALSLLQQCECTEDADPFFTAWELLEGELLRKGVLINASLVKIFDYPLIKTLDDIQKFLTFIRFKEVDLRSLGIKFPGEGEEHLGNSLLSFLVRSELPHFFIVELSRKTDCPFPSFRQFLACGDELICRLRNTRKPSPQNSLTPPSPSVQPLKPTSTLQTSTSRRFSSSKDQGEASGAQATYSSQKVASPCKFCGDCEHSSLKCTKVVSHNARVEMAKKKGLCFRCLSPGQRGRRARGWGVVWV